MFHASKRGLSDVVTTVLIILLVVASVVTIWAFIQPTLKNAGSSVQKGTVCLTNSIEPVSCKQVTYPDGGKITTVSYRRQTDDSMVKDVSSITLNAQMEDGSSMSFNASLIGSNGATATFKTGGLTAPVKDISLASDFILTGGSKTTCYSSAFACDKGTDALSITVPARTISLSSNFIPVSLPSLPGADISSVLTGISNGFQIQLMTIATGSWNIISYQNFSCIYIS